MAEKMNPRKIVRKDDADSHPKGHPFDHPVYKKLAVLNGEINKMSKSDIQIRLSEFKLDTRGVKEVLKKRLKNHYKKLKLMRANVRQEVKEPLYDYYLVIDFEATCEELNINYNHEIIEFPVVLVDSKDRVVVDEFHAYVRPVINPRLSTFCTTLTGITQSQVDKAAEFQTVLGQVEKWLEKHDLGTEHSFAVVTDGPWDMGRFMYNQCKLLCTDFPKWARKWCNLRKSYGNFYRCRKAKLVDMLNNLGMEFEGSQHSGIDDSRNIARILIRMLQDGATMRINERIYDSKLKKLTQNQNAWSSTESDLHVEEVSSESDDDHEKDPEVNGETSDADTKDKSQLTDMLSELKICDGHTPVSSDGEQMDDLLAYYALQKA